MEKTVAENIKKITAENIKKNDGVVMGQCFLL